MKEKSKQGNAVVSLANSHRIAFSGDNKTVQWSLGALVEISPATL